MECNEVRQLGDAFVSGQLSAETVEAIVGHLEQCQPCWAEIDGLRRLRAATRAALEHASELRARPEFADALAARLRAEADGSSPGLTRRRWLAIAASGLLAAGAVWQWRDRSTARFAALLHAAVGDHRYCALTFALEEKPIPLEEAARRYGGVHARVQTVEPSATTLAGGALTILDRHSCVFAGRRFSHVVLRYKEELVSLLITEQPGPGGDATPAVLPVTDGFHVVSWRGPQHAVFVVSALSDDDVQEVARVMAAPLARVLRGA